MSEAGLEPGTGPFLRDLEGPTGVRNANVGGNGELERSSPSTALQAEEDGNRKAEQLGGTPSGCVSAARDDEAADILPRGAPSASLGAECSSRVRVRSTPSEEHGSCSA